MTDFWGHIFCLLIRLCSFWTTNKTNFKFSICPNIFYKAGFYFLSKKILRKKIFHTTRTQFVFLVQKCSNLFDVEKRFYLNTIFLFLTFDSWHFLHTIIYKPLLLFQSTTDRDLNSGVWHSNLKFIYDCLKQRNKTICWAFTVLVVTQDKAWWDPI